MSGTWIGTPDEEIVPTLRDLLDLVTARATGERVTERQREKLDLACLHLEQAIKRLDEVDAAGGEG